MENSSIVKNCFKKLQNQLRKINGIDTALGGICEKYWVVCNNKKYLFKMPVDDDFSDFGEVFTSYLSYLLGYKCVKSMFYKSSFYNDNAKLGTLIESFYTNNIDEVISFSWLKDHYKRRHFSGFTVNEVLEICNEFATDKDLVIDKNLEQELKEMALMDYLLIQVDRHSNNINFLIENNNGVKKLKLAPMFDNGFCLYLAQNKNIIECINNQIEYEKVIEMHSYGIANPPPMFYIEYSEEINKPKENIVRDLTTELLKNEALMKLYKKFKSMDFLAEVNFVKSLYKRRLPHLYVNAMMKGVNNRITLIERELAKRSIETNAKEV